MAISGFEFLIYSAFLIWLGFLLGVLTVRYKVRQLAKR
jgi:hypothetical protein